jgi:colicin import membrane protein
LNAATVPYQIPAEPGRWRALALAALVHLALLAFLWFGVSWQNTVPVAIEAEIWSPQAREAAPQPEPLPPPVAQPEPPKPIPPKPAPIPEPVAKTPDPDIALEKKRKQETEKKLADELEKKRLLEEREKKRLAEEQEKQRLAELDKKKADEKRKKDLAKQAADEMRNRQEAAADAQLDKIRREKELKRLQSMAGESGAGDAERSSAPKTDTNFKTKILQRIKSNLNFNNSDAIPGNPMIEFDIELFPDGSVKDIKIVRKSGVDAYDEAVKRAVYRTAPIEPDPATGKVPPLLDYRMRLKENR